MCFYMSMLALVDTGNYITEGCHVSGFLWLFGPIFW